MPADVSLEAAGQWGQAPATPWSYSNKYGMLFFFSSLCQGENILKTPGFICPKKVQDTQIWRALHSFCRFTTCFTPCRVHLHQGASNPRKKKCFKIHSNCMQHAHSPGRGISLLRGAVRLIHHTHLSFLYILIECTDLNKQAYNMSILYS